MFHDTAVPHTYSILSHCILKNWHLETSPVPSFSNSALGTPDGRSLGYSFFSRIRTPAATFVFDDVERFYFAPPPSEHASMQRVIPAYSFHAHAFALERNARKPGSSSRCRAPRHGRSSSLCLTRRPLNNSFKVRRTWLHLQHTTGSHRTNGLRRHGAHSVCARLTETRRGKN